MWRLTRVQRCGSRSIAFPQALPDDGHFLVVRGLVQQGGIFFDLHALVDQQGGVAAVIDDQVGAGAVGPGQRLLGAPPVLFQRFALPGEDGGLAGLGDGGGGVVLGGKNIAGGPAHVGAQFDQGLDQHGRLDGHVQAAGDFQPRQRLVRAVFFADGHQAGHFGPGQVHFLAAPVGQGEVGDFIGQVAVLVGCFHVSSPFFSFCFYSVETGAGSATCRLALCFSCILYLSPVTRHLLLVTIVRLFLGQGLELLDLVQFFPGEFIAAEVAV